MTLDMRASKSCAELVKRFEELRTTAAQLSDGSWVVGYGHRLTAREGATVSAKDAEDLLTYDLRQVSEAVSALVAAPLSQDQFDALVAFTFDVGVEAFRTSGVRKRLNQGLHGKAARHLKLWGAAEGEPSLRRHAEVRLFKTSLVEAPAPVAAAAPGDAAPQGSASMAAVSSVSAKLHQLFPDAAPVGDTDVDLLPEPEPFPAAATAASAESGGGLGLARQMDQPLPEAVEPAARVEAPPVEAPPAPPAPRFFEPPPRRFPSSGPPMVFPTAANETEPSPSPFDAAPTPFDPVSAPPPVLEPAASAELESSPAPEPEFTAEPPPPPLAAEVAKPSATANIPPRPRPAPRPRRPWLLQASMGLLGVALFSGAIYSMLGGMATIWNLAVGLVGVVFMVPAAVHLLLLLVPSRADPPRDEH